MWLAQYLVQWAGQGPELVKVTVESAFSEELPETNILLFFAWIYIIFIISGRRSRRGGGIFFFKFFYSGGFYTRDRTRFARILGIFYNRQRSPLPPLPGIPVGKPFNSLNIILAVHYRHTLSTGIYKIYLILHSSLFSHLQKMKSNVLCLFQELTFGKVFNGSGSWPSVWKTQIRSFFFNITFL